MSALLLFALFTSVNPAVPQQPQSAAPVEAAKEAKPERKICKREMVTTSLHGSKRVCLTAKEWRVRNGEGGGVEDIGSAIGSRGN